MKNIKKILLIILMMFIFLPKNVSAKSLSFINPVENGEVVLKYEQYKGFKRIGVTNSDDKDEFEVYASEDGVVESIKLRHKGRYDIIIKHDDSYYTAYSQISELKVNVNDKVEKGSLIGIVEKDEIETVNFVIIKDHQRLSNTEELIK